MHRIEKIKFIKNRLEFCQRLDKEYAKDMDGFYESAVRLRIKQRASVLTMLRDDPVRLLDTNKFDNSISRWKVDTVVDQLYSMYNLWSSNARDKDMRKIYYDPILKLLKPEARRLIAILDYKQYGLL